MYINRFLYTELYNLLNYKQQNKIILLYGPRQVGKTTLIKGILDNFNFRKLLINADELKYHEILSSRDLDKMKLLVSGYELLFIDEAQRIPDIGINLKLLHDNFPELRIIVTGSSSLDLAEKTKEALTGRTRTYTLFPIAYSELSNHFNRFELENKLNEYLIFGQYPEIFSIDNGKEKYKYLNELTSAYLYKDIFELASIKHSSKIQGLLRLLAFQIGSEVSVTEIGNSLGMSKDTVNKYIDLLEKSFVIFRLSGFSRNLRKEVTKMDKIYFYDLGIRNSIIDNFNTLEFRNDKGQLWENFLIAERKKYLSYSFFMANCYFWRTYTGAELDYIEDHMGKIAGFEFKWGAKKEKAPVSWKNNYPEADFTCINRDNFFKFIIP